MCFSATASFTVAAVLLPVGAYTCSVAYSVNRRFLPLAAFPLAFGIQQAIEGIVWLDIESPGNVTRVAAIAFLFFSHLFWLAWVPFSVWMLTSPGLKKILALGFTIVGLAYGMSLFVPLAMNDQWVSVVSVQGSLAYQTTLFYDALFPRDVVHAMYAAVVLVPLLFFSNGAVRAFGVVVLIAVIVARIGFSHAYISVWCFFAAVASLCLVYVLNSKQAASPSG